MRKPKPFIRCSQLDQLFACPASRVMAPLVQARDSDESYEGKTLHWLVAAELITKHGAIPPPGGLPAADVPATYILPERSRWLYEFFLREALTVPTDWAMEVETSLVYEFDRFLLGGHPDLLAVNGTATRSITKDWKCGYRAVAPAECNNQALGYIVLQKLSWPTIEEAQFDIVQPRNDEDEGDQRVSSVTVRGAELDQAVAYLERKVNWALDNWEIIESGPNQCRWCPVGIQCPAIQGDIEAMKTKLTPEALAALRAQPDDALLGDIYVTLRTVKAAAEDAEDMLHARLDKTGRVTAGCGRTLTQSFQGGKYKVINHAAALAAARSELPDHELAKCLGYSTTELHAAIARVRGCPKTGKAEVTAEKIFDQKFLPNFEQGQKRMVKIS